MVKAKEKFFLIQVENFNYIEEFPQSIVMHSRKKW